MHSSHRRILAFDVRSRRAGFVLLESPHHLIDWGCLYCSNRDVSPARQLAKLLARTRPDRVVVVTPANQALARRRLRRMVDMVTKEAETSRVRVIVFSRRSVLRALDVKRRHAAAVLVTERFPVLKPRLPRPRRIQDSEHPSMCLFDAAAAGLAYFEKYARRRTAAATPPRAA